MRVLLIDDSADFREHARRMLAETLPEASVLAWDPAVQGRPVAGFDWGRFDCLVLDDTPGENADGLDWLREFRAEGHVPPTLILSDTGGEETAVRAIKAGASDYLKKSDLSAERLASAIRGAIADARETRRDVDSLLLTQPLKVNEIGEPLGTQPVSIPGYRVLRRIGEGGMSRVYLADRETDGLQLVLKVLDPRLRRDESFRQRFLREYRIIQRIQNEHVVMIFDEGFTEDYPYLAMEYFPGGDLNMRIRGGLGSMGSLKILVQIAKALDAVHTAGVVHRDLKPANIMFRANGRLAILDFGLARELDATSTLTQRGMVMATPLYMSPEQCLGHPHDPRGDLYSTGCILYEMLTGETPYQGDNPSALAYQHVHAPVPMLPAGLAGYQPLIDRLMAKKPDDRFQTARDLFAHIAH
jgi:DNA-binding NarL/FixJ family response regulator/tRNA A-37 threonylcarbamoyl transferase component Bud32